MPRIWDVVMPLIWEDSQFGRITVPVGFRTDLASVPPAVRDIPAFDPNGPSRKPAVLHDWCYCWQGMDRDRCDALLAAALVSVGISAGVAEIYRLAVHDFGERFYHQRIGGPFTTDFDTVEHYQQWHASLSTTFKVDTGEQLYG